MTSHGNVKRRQLLRANESETELDQLIAGIWQLDQAVNSELVIFETLYTSTCTIYTLKTLMERAIYLSNKLGAVVYCSALSPDPICSLRPQEGIKGKLRRPETTSVSSKVYLSIFTVLCSPAPNAMNRLKLTSSLRSRQSPNISV